MGSAGRGKIGEIRALKAWDNPSSRFPEEGTRRGGGVARRRIGTGGARVSRLLFGIDPGDREFGFAIMGYGYGRGGGGARGGLVFCPSLRKEGRGQTTA
jgi:hypothetical protein